MGWDSVAAIEVDVPAQVAARQLRLGLAVVSLGAAAIHFAAVGHHLREYVPFGVFFVIVAWLQAMWAVGIVAVPSRRLLQAASLGSVVVIAVWVVSRTWGVPFGPAAGRPEATAAADVSATVLEAVIVIGSMILLRAEAHGIRSSLTGAPSVALAGGLSILAMTTTTLALSTSDGHDVTSSAHGGSHHVMTGGGEADPGQIETIRAAMARYEDIDVARAEGWEQEHADEPEIGAHFARPAENEVSLDQPDLVHPDYLMYSQIGRDDWELVAVAYVVDQSASPDPPTDLRGASYHAHSWNCIADGEELDEEDFGVISRDECQAMQGNWSPGGVWMTHVWFIDNPSGTFAETNPALI